MFVAAESFSEAVKTELSVIVNQTLILKAVDTPWALIKTDLVNQQDFNIKDRIPLGFMDGKACEAVFVDMPEDESPVEAFEWVRLRSILSTVEDELFQLAGRAVQLGLWIDQHKFCGRCGHKTRKAKSDRSFVCSNCELRFYPKISPCVMVLVTRGDECLLASGVRHPEGLYSALAGFIEAGETAEQAAVREVAEEVSVKFNNLQYFGSQPWPFPGQLMLAYMAEYTEGEIVVDEKEIAHADWYSFERLPNIPPLSTISGQLIQHFIDSRKTG